MKLVRRILPVFVGGLAAGLAVPAGAALSPPQVTPAAADWTTYGGNAERMGSNTVERQLTAENVSHSRQRWSVDLGSNSTTSPIVIQRVRLAAGPRTLVYVGTVKGDIVAIDAARGSIIWRRNVGHRSDPTCQYIPGGYGVTGTPVADLSTGRIYAIGGTGLLFAFDLRTGATIPGWPVRAVDKPAQLYVYSALTLANHKIYVANASYCDHRPYRAYVAAVDDRSARITATFYPSGPVEGGGVWGVGGVSVASDGSVYAATGNSFGRSEYDYFGNSVVRLTPDLRPVAAHHPLLRGADVDFGATPVLFRAPGCPPQLSVKNKTGALFVYDQLRIDRGPVRRWQLANPQAQSFIGADAYDPSARMLFTSTASDSVSGVYRHGITAFRINSACQLTVTWSTTAGPPIWNTVSSPTVAGGVVYFGDGIGKKVHAFDEYSGAKLWDSDKTIKGPVLVAPVVAGGTLYASAWDRHLHAYRP